MNTALILAAGVGQRMRNGGLPKQFLKLNGKPIVIYTLEKFQDNEDIDEIIVVCHGGYVEMMEEMVSQFGISKVKKIIVGGNDRQSSLKKGLDTISQFGSKDDDIVVIHDGVRPLVTDAIISENIRIAKQHGNAVTVHPVTESVVITSEIDAGMNDFKKRKDTYSLTAPQTFKVGEIVDAYKKYGESSDSDIPLLDAAMVYAKAGGEVQLVKEQRPNIKITTPEDFYVLKAMLELEENKFIFGL